MSRFTLIARAGALSALMLVLIGAGALARSHRAALRGDAAGGPWVVTVTARDYAFEAPDTVPAGLTTTRLVNRGPELHHVWLVRLEGGRGSSDLLTALEADGKPHVAHGMMKQVRVTDGLSEHRTSTERVLP